MPGINATHDPARRSWVDSANAAGTDFPIQNLPVGIFLTRDSAESPRIGVAIGDRVLDLKRCSEGGFFGSSGFSEPLLRACEATTLNPLMALGPGATAILRRQLVELLKEGASPTNDLLLLLEDAELLVPATIGDYTDFYASIFHATNIGSLFRPDNPLLPNYKHLPIAYHGRSSSIGVSGMAIRRPYGQIKPGDRDAPEFRPSSRLDYEVEVAAFIGTASEQGLPVALNEAEGHVFGLCLLNDWSARDIQAWEYQPLGPFLAKNFATSISPWVVTLDALAPFRCPAFQRAPGDPQPLPYLSSASNETHGGFDISVEAYLQSGRMREQRIAPVLLSRGSYKDMYWTLAQMLTHHTSNGCNLRPGDVLASGTVSGPDDQSRGCLLEMTRGTQPITLPTGETRLFLADDDEVILRGFCERSGYVRIGFGECRGRILPAHSTNS